MKSILTDSENKKPTKYPYLGIYEDGSGAVTIVFFKSRDTGICVHRGAGYNNLGDFCSSWSEDEFKFYEGEVRLSN